MRDSATVGPTSPACGAERVRKALIVLGRYPTAGKVKTRLMPLLGAEGCRRLQEALLFDTVDRTCGLADQTFLYLDGGSAVQRAVLGQQLPDQVQLRVQTGADLGQRMYRAAIEVSAAADALILVGTDAPTLPLDHIRKAFDQVKAGKTVFVPVEDGGYCLLGLRQPDPALFVAVKWGSSSVLAQSLESVPDERRFLLPSWYDVDVEADLRRLAGTLAGDFEGFPRRTARLLSTLGLAATEPCEPGST